MGDSCIARFNTNGSRDTSFDGDGLVTTIIDWGSYIGSVAVQSDGKIVATGTFLARYGSDGSLDTSFDTDGMVTYPVGRGVALQGDGAIVVAVGCPSGVFGSQRLLPRALQRQWQPRHLLRCRWPCHHLPSEWAISSRRSPSKTTARSSLRGGCDSAAFEPNDFCLARYDGGGAAEPRAWGGVNDGFGVVQTAIRQVSPRPLVCLPTTPTPTPGTTLDGRSGGRPCARTLTLNANGSFTYTANVAFSGTDSFTYRASDGSLTSNVVTATISVATTADLVDIAAQDGANHQWSNSPV